MSILSSFINQGNARFWTNSQLLVLITLTSMTESFNAHIDIKLLNRWQQYIDSCLFALRASPIDRRNTVWLWYVQEYFRLLWKETGHWAQYILSKGSWNNYTVGNFTVGRKLGSSWIPCYFFFFSQNIVVNTRHSLTKSTYNLTISLF